MYTDDLMDEELAMNNQKNLKFDLSLYSVQITRSFENLKHIFIV